MALLYFLAWNFLLNWIIRLLNMNRFYIKLVAVLSFIQISIFAMQFSWSVPSLSNPHQSWQEKNILLRETIGDWAEKIPIKFRRANTMDNKRPYSISYGSAPFSWQCQVTAINAPTSDCKYRSWRRKIQVQTSL